MKIRRRCAKIFLSTFIVVCVAGLYLFFQYHALRCSHSELTKGINELCALYMSKQIAGDLCEPLCKEYSVRPVGCLGFGEGKRVIRAKWGNMDIVLKTKDFNMSAHDDMFSNYDGESVDIFRNNVLLLLRDMHGIRVPNDKREGILDQMWSHRFNWRESSRAEIDTAMRSLWSLMLQVEYAYMKYYQGFEHIPTIYGTCGVLYAVRHMPPSPLFNLNPLDTYKNSWSDRVRVALSFLDLVEDLDIHFPEPLHLCDVQSPNFGFLMDSSDPILSSQQPVVFLIDMDMVNSEYFLTEARERHCKNNEQCDFFQCKGRCVKGACDVGRANNNLQSVCERLFIPSWVRGHALLSNPPEFIRHDLESLLHSCAKPETAYGSSKTPKDILNKIRMLLMKSYNVLT